MKVMRYAAAAALLMSCGAAYAQELPRLPPGPAAGHDATLLISVTPTVTLSALASLVLLIADSGGFSDSATIGTSVVAGRNAIVSSGTL
jgi:hypothetical protein